MFEQAKRNGYVRVIVDGIQYELSEEINLDRNIKHNIEIVCRQAYCTSRNKSRLTDSIESVFRVTGPWHFNGECAGR